MSAHTLPPRPNLDQLKRQAKELLAEWLSSPQPPATPPRLRDAQRAIAERYGFTSWDALRAHVEQASATAPAPRWRGLDYDDPVPDVVEVQEPITDDLIRRLAASQLTGVKVGPGVPAGGLVQFGAVRSIERIDLSGRDDLIDRDLAFLVSMPWLTALSLGGCRGLTDGVATHLRGLVNLEQVNLQWTALGDGTIAALAGKPRLRRLAAGARLTDEGAARLRDYPALAEPSDADSFLSIKSARTLTDRALEHIGGLQGVVALDVHMSVFGSPHYTAAGAAHLKRMGALQELNFHGNLATDAALAEIAQIPRLRHLHCQDIVSGDEGFVALGRCRTLEALGARTCVRLGARGLAAIAGLPRLRSLSAGGPQLTDEGWRPIADAAALVGLTPIHSRDGAFAHIARAPRLEHLTNMYNRTTGDGATRHLRGHPRLTSYSAFGTQVGDESLRILAELPSLARLEFENCASITDEGLRALAQAPRLTHVSVWSCKRVKGHWVAAMPPAVEAKSEDGPAGQVDGYRAETLLDYPDLAVPPDVDRLRAPAPAFEGLATLVPLGLRTTWTADGLQLSLDEGIDPRWVSAVTEHAFGVPFRVELTARPIAMLKLGFGAHNRFVGFDESGGLRDLAPWFMKTPAQAGRRHDPPDTGPAGSDAWMRIELVLDPRGARLLVNGALRHTWEGNFSSFRGRVAVGLAEAGVITLRKFSIAPPV